MKTSRFIFTLYLCLQLFSYSFAQLPSVDWSKKFGSLGNDSPESIKQLPDGSFLVIGSASGGGGDVTGAKGAGDMWVLKLTNTGQLSWQRTLGGNNLENGRSAHPTPDGGYIIGGVTFSDNGDVSGNHGNGDTWVVKLNAERNIEWQKCFGGTKYDGAATLQPTADGGYIFAGVTQSTDGDVIGYHGGQGFDAWVVKISATGNIQWQQSLGGTGNDNATTVQQTVDGGYIVIGSTQSNDGDVKNLRGYVDIWAVKLDANGFIQWQKCLGGTGEDLPGQGFQTPDGGYIIAGKTNSKDRDVVGHIYASDVWVVKLNANGVIQWQKCLGGRANDEARSMTVADDGGYVIGGNTNSLGGDIVGAIGGTDAWMVKINDTGTLQWQRCFGGTNDDYINSLIRTSDGNYAFAGGSYSSNNDIRNHIGNNDYWIVKVGSNGTLPQRMLCDTINTCMKWIRDSINNSLATAPEHRKFIIAERAKWDGIDLVILRSRVDPTKNYSRYEVMFDCKGNVVQRCPPFGEGGCNPFREIVTEIQLTTNPNIYYYRHPGITVLDTLWRSGEELPACLSDAWTVTPTSISHTIVLKKEINRPTNGDTLRRNDLIGFFYEHNGAQFCAGKGIWNGTGDLIMTVYGNDALPPSKNGFLFREEFKIKLWDTEALEEKEIRATFMPVGSLGGLVDATNLFKEDGFSAISGLQKVINSCLSISLKTGVNYISSYIIPKLTLPDLIDGIKDNLFELKNDQGDAIIPSYGIYDTDLTNWVVTEGYKATMTQPANLEICGEQVNPNTTPIPIAKGVQWIAYLRDIALSPASQLAEKDSCIIWMRNTAGEIYVPALDPPGNMALMQPTHGYRLKAACSDIIHLRSEGLDELRHFTTTENTGFDATIIVPANVISAVALPGDEIGVFNSTGILCGAAVVSDKNFQITIWGDDSSTPQLEGLQIGETYMIRIWQAQTDREFPVEATLMQGEPRFQVDMIQVLKSLSVLATNTNNILKENLQWRLYPNPANNWVTIEFENGIDEGIIEIVNSNGTKLKEVKFSSGTQKLDIAELISGIYWCKVTTKKGASVKRFIVLDR